MHPSNPSPVAISFRKLSETLSLSLGCISSCSQRALCAPPVQPSPPWAIIVWFLASLSHETVGSWGQNRGLILHFIPNASFFLRNKVRASGRDMKQGTHRGTPECDTVMHWEAPQRQKSIHQLPKNLSNHSSDKENQSLKNWWKTLCLSVLNVHWTEWRWRWNSQYFGHLMQRTESLEKTLMLGETEGSRRRGSQRVRWLDISTSLIDMSLSKH